MGSEASATEMKFVSYLPAAAVSTDCPWPCMSASPHRSWQCRACR